jgi:DNA polymerase I-like protein with 3'-5' exonuclease and polymerase domains
MKETMKSVGDVANRRGYIFTILKRRRRFDVWEPYDFNLSRNFEFLKSKKAVADFVTLKIQEALQNNEPPPKSGVRRAKVYKALNSLIQGSAADLMKKAMVDIWKSGLCSDLGLPKITVHDELDFSKPKTKIGDKAFKEALRLMENAIKFKVPIIVDAERGKNWGELSEWNWRK